MAAIWEGLFSHGLTILAAIIRNVQDLELQNLIENNVMDNVSNEFLFRNLSSLSEASFCVGPPFYGSNNNSGDAFHIYKLLSGTSSVKLLDAYLSCQTDANDYVLPTFHNLTQLNFGAAINSNWNLKLLADFLRCSPNLEVLILKGSYYNNTAKSWNPPQEVPSCLLLHLKKIEFKEFSGNDCELEVIEYLLKNAIVLKKMTIDCQYSDECFCGQLAVYPRGSMTCRLNLLI
ncbi:hypothetical protein TEA_018420 [Camellia sinensis var. sinensis]|uniref:FBD domain-containing protein n=1 Tax=Camellia sinensis var. sinensis TaxID=542762 RepID=A0A4V3WIQ9_CAMSN|nr:hypothetical protein TEA_018420 [Camellia sinensis var. sinensis]